MDWFSLTLLSAFSLATADALTKKLLGDYRARELVLIRFGLSGLILLPWVLLQPWPVLPAAFWGWMLVLAPLEIMAMLLYMLAIKDSAFSDTLPYLAFTPVFTIITAYVFLGEQVSLNGLSGIGLIVIGAWWLNIEHAKGDAKIRSWLAPFKAIIKQRGSRLMLITAAVYSLTSVFSKAAMLHASPVFFGPFYFVVIGAVSFLVFGLREPRIVTALWRRPTATMLVAITMAIMVVSHFIAIANIEVAYMIAVKRSSLLFGIVYGALLFGEKRALSHFFAGALMVTGIALISN